MKVASSWSGGKDCCLALYRSLEQGVDVEYLFNLISQDLGHCCFHGIDSGLLKLQAELMGIPLVQKSARDDMNEYENDFKAGVALLRGIGGIVFGDIYLNEHRDWAVRVCRDMNIEALEPLWNENPSRLVEEFIDAGFEALIISCHEEKFGKDFVGRIMSREMIRELERRSICTCGENGEFHTLVVNGPIFKRRIEILEAEPVLKDGFWKHWSLDIQKYK
ncbi:MAG: diphthine--ammonia ligase [Kiritimatiellae bacterium]|nr:diphthine--ammonia ligase [Kiritimatiellia bacterium]MDD5521397.1 diphthine--ammonia ligase [Kiritimatiellia bacterium]